MPENMHTRYPARSKLRKKERLYDCAPIINYDVFVDGIFEDQVKEYLQGIAHSSPYLAQLGASPEQIKEFTAILEATADQLIANQQDQASH